MDLIGDSSLLDYLGMSISLPTRNSLTFLGFQIGLDVVAEVRHYDFMQEELDIF